MSDIILHHYPLSPFAEKVRVALGIKGAHWRSVTIPVIMPKPDLVALTGGYRRTPVMQIGADVYCDTQCILRELERRFPTPSLYAETDAGTANALAFWSERSLFSTAVGVAMGARPDALLEGFIEDRSRFTGREINVAKLTAALPVLIDQLRVQLVWFETALADGRAFLCGDKPTLVDCAAYHPCWFMLKHLSDEAAPLAELPRLRAWMPRVAALGHGHSTELSASAAIEIARTSRPAAVRISDPHDPFGRKPGDRVSVTPDDTGRDPVLGELVALSREEIVIARTDERAGELAVHFPRAGFVVRPA
jgi:glutathione S-transferase